MEPVSKIPRIDTSEVVSADPVCKHYVIRKKRFCKMTVATGREYCGEHTPRALEKHIDASCLNRIPCPLDPKHTVFAAKLQKHLLICNARPTEQPEYIVPGINTGEISDDDVHTQSESNSNDLRLSDLDDSVILAISSKINAIYDAEELVNSIEEEYLEHPIFKDLLNQSELGHETEKHLKQTASLLGHLDRLQLLQPHTTFIEYGAGKGQVSYYVAKATNTLDGANVVLVDRATQRFKKDNKIEDRNKVQRIRADIADFCLDKFQLPEKNVCTVGLGKHVCGNATDFALRCIVNGIAKSKDSSAFLFALCCYHRCDWMSFIGRKYLEQNNFSAKEFLIMTKMVSWAVCGSGFSRERREAAEENKTAVPKDKINRFQKEEIGRRCKRLMDFARIQYLQEKGFKCELKCYVPSTLTPENVCLLGVRQ